jgi:hypothetical protein
MDLQTQTPAQIATLEFDPPVIRDDHIAPKILARSVQYKFSGGASVLYHVEACEANKSRTTLSTEPTVAIYPKFQVGG